MLALCRDTQTYERPVRWLRRRGRAHPRSPRRRSCRGRGVRATGSGPGAAPGRTAPCWWVGCRRGERIREEPGRAHHGVRRGRAALHRLRAAFRGRRDRGTGGHGWLRRAVSGRTPGRPACHGGAPRCRLEQAGPSRIGARQGCYGLPDAHEPQRARRGPIPSAVVSA